MEDELDNQTQLNQKINIMVAEFFPYTFSETIRKCYVHSITEKLTLPVLVEALEAHDA